MAIGVSSLLVSMAVFSGYVSTLEKTVQDAVGHLLILKRGASDQSVLLQEIEPMIDGLEGKTPFVYAEAILAHKGKINGVVIEGVEEGTVGRVLKLKDRVISGKLDFAHAPNEMAKVLIGKGVADKYGLKIGDSINLVVPMSGDFQGASFRPKLRKFSINGVINFGRYDYDSRYIVMEIKDAQDFLELGGRVTGYRFKISNPYRAKAIAESITNKYGATYWARDWQEVNRYLFEAAKLEKVVLFFVLMILVVAAAFNIANTLFVSVVQRYRDISVLKTMGAPNSMIRQIFAAQGLMVGFVGASIGIIVGLALCPLIEIAIIRMNLIPAEVYKIDRIELGVHWTDVVAILLASLAVCFIATLVPSRRGAKISPVEGLRYD